MNAKWIGRIVVIASLAAVLPVAQARLMRKNTEHFSMGASDHRPRFDDARAIYLWHDGNTFYVAVGDEQRGNIFVRADVNHGSIDNVTHRREREWRKGGERKWEDRRWERGTDNEGVHRQGRDVIEYEAQGGAWDFVRFDVRRGDSIKFNFDVQRNGRNHRAIYVGGDANRSTHADTIIIDFNR